MESKKTSKSNFHPNNKHQANYDIDELCKSYPPLSEFVFKNKYQTNTIDFSNPEAVKKLNRALLFAYYKLTFWDFPDDNLCPPIPGRVDYIHYLADVLKESGLNKNTTVLDIGTGASCIYPILGNAVYGWRFVGTDIDEKALKSAEQILKMNNLIKSISLRHQSDSTQIFKGILNSADKFSATMCNPPFFRSEEEAIQANTRKLKGLGTNGNTVVRNFSGKSKELWYKGGEKAFVHTYLYESSFYKTQCFWYTTLVSKKENLESMYTSLKKLKAAEIKTIPMYHGNKVTRIVAWTFLSKGEQKLWKENENGIL